jgi:hypothetical protein
VIPEDWPSLPSNLYFLRDGDLNIWLAEGEHVSSIPLPNEGAAGEILKYQVFAGGRSIFYVTTGGALCRFDRAEWSNTQLPTTGRMIHNDQAFFDVTDDESRLVYLAWGVQPTAEHQRLSLDSTGTLLAMDLTDPRQPQIELGFCEGSEETSCHGFVMAPDGSALMMSDIQGFHLINLDGGDTGASKRTELELPSGSEETDKILGWSPDGHWFVLAHHTRDGSGLTIVDAKAPGTPPIFLPLCNDACRIRVGWRGAELWIALSESDRGCLLRYTMGEPVPAAPGEIACFVPARGLHPMDLKVLQDGAVAVLHQGSPSLSPGLYLYQPDVGDLTPVALLSDPLGRMIWAADGSAFVTSDAAGIPQTLGWIQRGMLLDVRTRLAAAVQLQWEPEARGEP